MTTKQSTRISTPARIVGRKDGSLTIDNASVQRLLDYGLLHFTDEGFYIGPWPGTNRPSAEAAREPTPSDVVERGARQLYRDYENTTPEQVDLVFSADADPIHRSLAEEMREWFRNALLASLKETTREALLPWRCFHCNEVFADRKLAEDHFGQTTLHPAACVDPLRDDERAMRERAMFYERAWREALKQRDEARASSASQRG